MPLLSHWEKPVINAPQYIPNIERRTASALLDRIPGLLIPPTVPLSRGALEAIADGTATLADGDYQSATGTLSFAPGQTSATLTVPINGDLTLEPAETVSIDLSNAQGASIVDAQALVTVNNDDSASVAIDSVSVPEGNSGSSTLIYTVTLSGAVQGGFTLPYQSADGSATYWRVDKAVRQAMRADPNTLELLFVEGVRAVIFEKDNAPKWEPATPEAVTDALVDSLFAPLPPEKEWTPLPELSA